MLPNLYISALLPLSVCGGGYCFYTYGYTYCSTGCCGTYSNRYCCSATSAVTIAGTVIGVVAVIAVVIILFLCYWYTSRKKKVANLSDVSDIAFTSSLQEVAKTRSSSAVVSADHSQDTSHRFSEEAELLKSPSIIHKTEIPSSGYQSLSSRGPTQKDTKKSNLSTPQLSPAR